MAGLCTNYEGAWGPCGIQMGLTQENSEVEGNEEKNEEVVAEKDVQVMAEEELEEVNLGSDSQEPRPISISLSLTEKENTELILLLKEFKDVFA